MKILFINHAYPQDKFDQLYEDSRGLLQIPDNVLQWNIVEGLEANGVEFTLASIPALPAWPRYKYFVTPAGTMRLGNRTCGHYLSYCDVPFIKQLSERKALHCYLKHWCEENIEEDRLYVLVYTQWSHHLRAALDIKKIFPQLVVGCIITDLIESAKEYASNRSFLKRIQVKLESRAGKQMFPHVDRFILLTKQMEEHIPEAKGRSLVMEGIASLKYNNEKVVNNISTNRILLYTGVLEGYAGVDQMVKAFLLTKNEEFRLVICGSGSSEAFVKRSAEKDSRIEYKGKVSHSVVIDLQQQATLLINPRRPNGGITKYSFPSKTMEYMASGTPMIGYKLEGIPSEYFNHMYIPDDFSVEALSRCINRVLKKSNKELEKKAEDARRFVLTQKSSRVQVKRIIDFLENLTDNEA